MKLSEEFFSLQVAFAQRFADLAGRPLASVLHEATCFYIVFFLDGRFDPSHPVWIEYLRIAAEHAFSSRCAFEFFQHRLPMRPPDRDRHFGSFYYRSHEHGIIRNHFEHRDDSPHGPLSRVRIEVRSAELRAMYHHVKTHEPDATVVQGRSWLYNMAAYKRLFPPEFIASARPVEGEFRRLELWGQFIDHDGLVKPSLGAPFLDRINRARGLDDLLTCFPYPILTTQCPIERFYDFYESC